MGLGVAGTAAAVGAAGSIGGSLISSSAAGDAAQTQASAATQASNQQYAATQQALQQQQANFNTVQGNLNPFIQTGTGALSGFQQELGLTPGGDGSLNPNSSLLGNYADAAYGQQAPTNNAYANAPMLGAWDPTSVASTPGYQFTQQQAQIAAQSGFAAQGLGSSGAAVLGAAQTAGNVANTYYQQDFNNYLNQYQAQVQGYQAQNNAFQQEYNQYLNNAQLYYAKQQQNYNVLSGFAGLGLNAASGLGSLSTNIANSMSQITQAGGNALAAGTIGAGNANAQGTVGSANAFSGSLGNLGQIANQYSYLNAYQQSALGQGGIGGTAATNPGYTIGTTAGLLTQ